MSNCVEALASVRLHHIKFLRFALDIPFEYNLRGNSEEFVGSFKEE